MDFLFCFSAPVLWLAHAAISGAFIVLLRKMILREDFGTGVLPRLAEVAG